MLPVATLFNPTSFLQKRTDEERPSAKAPETQQRKVSQDSGLIEQYTFQSFVVARNNEFAHAACSYVAECPNQAHYSPLYICGPNGMGKTHLMHAIGNHIKKQSPNVRLRSVSGERFLNECISGIRRNEMKAFRGRYREQCDVLLMDDIHILGRGEAVQEEFFHTLNHFSDNGKQIVTTSDLFPGQIRGLENRIRSRLEWGLIADIHGPNLETLAAILKFKAERRGVHLDKDTINLIAGRSKRSVRVLEGNFTRLKAFSELRGTPISFRLAKQVLVTQS